MPFSLWRRNLSTLTLEAMLFQKEGPALDLVKNLKQLKSFRRARFDLRSRGKNVQYLVLGIGQMHPVLHGRFERFQARRIAKVQAWIFDACHFLSQNHHVLSFGQEGFASMKAGPERYRYNADTLKELGEEIKSAHGSERFLKKIAQRWRRALKRNDAKKAQEYAMGLNALSLLQALDHRISMFPIEQSQAHSHVSDGIMRLDRLVKSIEHSPAYRSAKRKKGKKLTKEEYGLMKQRNKLVKEFNVLIKHPERDKAIFREVLKQAEGQRLTVFILGQGHRHGMLKLVRKHAPDNILFAWVTPPMFWWGSAMVRRVGWGFVLLFGFWVLLRML